MPQFPGKPCNCFGQYLNLSICIQELINYIKLKLIQVNSYRIMLSVPPQPTIFRLSLSFFLSPVITIFPVYFLSLILYSFPRLKIRNFFYITRLITKMTPSKAKQVLSLVILVITFPQKPKTSKLIRKIAQ